AWMHSSGRWGGAAKLSGRPQGVKGPRASPVQSPQTEFSDTKLLRDLPRAAPVRVHDPDLERARLRALERDVASIDPRRGPLGPRMRMLAELADGATRDVDDAHEGLALRRVVTDVVARLERDRPAVRRPRRPLRPALRGRQPDELARPAAGRIEQA